MRRTTIAVAKLRSSLNIQVAKRVYMAQGIIAVEDTFSIQHLTLQSPIVSSLSSTKQQLHFFNEYNTMGGAPPRPTGLPRDCSAVSDLCPVEGTIYGYTPSLPANAAFAGFFGIAMIINLIYGIRYKTWTYMVALSLGCLAECGGYVGRVLMHNNPWNDMAFNIQIVLLIFAPSFLAAGIYLTLKHIVLQFGQEWSRLRPGWYTYIFIACDVSSLAMQSAGGAMAAMADPGEKIGDIGTNLMIAGIIWQVVGKINITLMSSYVN